MEIDTSYGRAEMDNLTDSSDVEASFFLDTKCTQLSQENMVLTKENTQLRVQFNEAVKIAESVKPVQEENQILKEKNRVLISENQELIKRIDISSRAIEELNAKMIAQKHALSEQHTIDLKSFQQENERIKKESEKQISFIADELERVNSLREQADTEVKTYRTQISRLTESALRYFSMPFHSISEITSFLNSTQPPIISEKQTEKPKSEPKATATKAKSNKKEIQALISERNSLQNQLTNLIRESKTEKAHHQAELRDYEQKFTQLQEEFQMSEISNRHTIQLLESKIEHLKCKSAPSPKPSPAPIPPTPIQDFSKQRELAKQMANLTQEKEDLEQDKKDLKRKLDQKSQEIESLRAHYEEEILRYKDQKPVVQIVKEPAPPPVVVTKKIRSKTDRLELQRKDERIQMLNSQIDRMKQEAYSQQMALTNVKRELSQQKAMVEQADQERQMLEERIQETSESFRRKMEEKPKVVEVKVPTKNPEDHALKLKLQSFLSAISAILGLHEVQIDEFGQDSGASIIKKVGEWKKSLSLEQRKNQDARRIIDSFLQTFEVPNEQSAISKMSEIKSKMSDLAMKAEKVKDLKRALETEQKGRAADMESSMSTKANYDSKIAAQNEKISELKSTLERTKLELESVKAQLNEQIQISDNERETSESELKQYRASCQQTEQKLIAKIKDLETQQRENEAAQIAISRMKKKGISQKAKITELERTIGILKQELESVKEHYREQNESQRKTLSREFDEGMSEMKMKLNLSQNTVETLEKKLKVAEQGLKDARDVALAEQRNRRKVERDLLQEKQEKERIDKMRDQILEARVAEAIAAKEAERVSIVDSLEAAHKRFLLHIVDLFHDDFDPNDSIDDKTVMKLIGKAAAKMQSLSDQEREIRRAVGAKRGVPTSEAISQIMKVK